MSLTCNDSPTPVEITLTGTGTAPGKALSTTTLAFGEVVANTPSTLSFTITNTGTADLVVETLTPTGPYTHDLTVPLTLQPNTAREVQVTFTPTAAGTQNGTLSLTCNDSPTPVEITLTGTGTAPEKTLSTTTLAFGEVVANTPKTLSFTLTNTGTADLVVETLTPTGPYTHDLTVPLTLAPNTAREVQVTFTPTAAGAQNGTLSLTCNDSPTPVEITLTGTGTAPGKALSTTTLAFGEVVVNTPSTLSFTITNTGTAELVVETITPTGPYTHDLTVPLTLAPNTAREVQVTFTPTAAGAQNGSLSLTCNDSPTPVEITLTGTGTAPGKALSTTTLAFGEVVVNTPSTLSFTLTNTGTAELVVETLTPTGPYTHDLTVPLTLAPNTAREVQVTFTPTAAGAQNGTLSLTCNDSPTPVDLTLTGTGTAPGKALSTTTLAFGEVVVNTPSTLSFTITNTGTADLVVETITPTGPYTHDLTVPLTLAPNTAREVQVTFTPTAAGAQNGTLNLTCNDSPTPVEVTLTGTGTVPATPGKALSTTTLAFGEVVVNTPSTRSFTLTNTGTADLVVETITPHRPLYPRSDGALDLVAQHRSRGASDLHPHGSRRPEWLLESDLQRQPYPDRHHPYRHRHRAGGPNYKNQCLLSELWRGRGQNPQ